MKNSQVIVRLKDVKESTRQLDQAGIKYDLKTQGEKATYSMSMGMNLNKTIDILTAHEIYHEINF